MFRTGQITERDFLITEFAKVMAESFGTIGIEQYMPIAEKLFDCLKQYADATAGKSKS